ncbi:recombinase family protein [Streptomyces rapamycinicus]|uniref:Integrase n=2 Tax=Streptomyces rapamycinicus TaxID=1226757 RepID=A0A0A0NA24_STRRN|nr:recombinase family protein [Streptomyces rapamycinicus]AGP56297.1 integrase [Streptomyces rapamycinicus NRRL 5491]MBB4783892.1 DNA invertase Pin-like site-specific DNA recombinase [Streptomyces rapamycinicus]RLV80618.1 integrase [Streptomyces rapamycinicus NRRL 5491]UTO64258.1 recombinase family protein [Streptomyces rapamycinicus]UTP32213.1 recombinase family protein [Streptomyces rapamycinicus NRRL 5491]
MARKVGIYTRISRDDEGEALGVARQRTDCERLADLRTWQPVKIYEDNDVSAFKRNVVRDEFELMLKDLRAGLIDGVVAYDLDRLARQPRDLERLIEIFDERPRLEFATVTNDVNLGTADGRTMARVMVAFANKSSHDTSRRIKRKHLELAQQGKANGGPAPYGWLKDDRNKVDPEAAKHIREAQKEVLAGVRIGTIRTRWQEQGLGNPRQGTKRMAHHHVEHILTNPRLVRYRTYHGEILHGDDGQPVMGEWDPINTVEEWEAVCAAIAERKQTKAGQSLARRYLLSGIARCGLCKSKIRGQVNQQWKPGSQAAQYKYQCSKVNGGCGKVGRVGDPVDKLIARLVLKEQREKAAATGVPVEARWPRERELEGLLQDIVQLIEAEKAKAITVSTLLQLLPAKEQERDALKLERARFYKEQKQAEAKGNAGDLTEEEFFALPIERQREIVLHSLTAVVIHPAGRGKRKFDPDLIDPVWR